MLMQDKTDTEVLEIVNQIMDNLMDASTRIDHEQHTRDFTERLRAIVTQEYLSKVCRQYQNEKGFFADRELISLIRRPDAIAVLWKQQFTKAKGDFVAEALFVDRGGEYKVDHVMIW